MSILLLANNDHRHTNDMTFYALYVSICMNTRDMTFGAFHVSIYMLHWIFKKEKIHVLEAQLHIIAADLFE